MRSAAALLLALGGCRGCGALAAPGLAPVEAARRTCAAEVARTANDEPAVRIARGERGVDVVLHDLEGEVVPLSSLLGDRPVLLVTGSATCPVYQRHRDPLRKLAKHLDGHVDTVLVYTIEAHPRRDPSPYRGAPWEVKTSDRRQARTDDARRASAAEQDLGAAVRVLVDPLDDGDPFWCTWGPAPNAAWLLRTDGRVEAVHTWFDPPSMLGSVEALLGDAAPPRPAGWRGR